MDELKDLVPDAEISLLAFNVVTGSYDPRSSKSTLLEFIKTMRYGVKDTAKGPLRDIMDVSEYTGMVFGTVGEGTVVPYARGVGWDEISLDAKQARPAQ
eukprot:jgi/Tetstr1/453446/TSEL_040427.t1